MEEEKQYCVCIDFGHGETTASYIDLTATYPENKEGAYDVPKLNILKGSTDEARKVETVICRGEDGQWKFATDQEDFARPDLAMQFKAEVNKMEEDDKEHYKAFINLVFKAIIANNNSLHFDENNPQDRNFDLCIACPSAWGEDDKNGHNSVIEDYKNFFLEALPINEIKFIIRESDAAFFKFIHLTKQNPNLKILVIDLGSSTIDFTYYPHNENNKYPQGAANGASRVERAIQDWCTETQDTYKKAKSVIPAVLEETDNKKINWEMSVRHYIKEQKEVFYTKSQNKMGLNLQTSRVVGDILTDKIETKYDCLDILYHCNINKEFLDDPILTDYRSDLKDDLKRLHNSGMAPEMILLTGGASRMPWIKDLVEDVFQGTEVFCDNNPSYVVSDGIALYAYADSKFRKMLEEMETTIKNELTDDILVEFIEDAVNDAFKEVQLPPILKICDDFIEGKFTTLRALLNKVEQHNNSIIGANATQINTQVSNKVHAKLDNMISGKINKIFQECFHTKSSISFQLNWNKVDFSSAPIDNDYDARIIYEIGDALFCQGIFGGTLKYDRERDWNERKQFGENFRKCQEGATFRLSEPIRLSTLAACNSSINQTLNTVKTKGLFWIY